MSQGQKKRVTSLFIKTFLYFPPNILLSLKLHPVLYHVTLTLNISNKIILKTPPQNKTLQILIIDDLVRASLVSHWSFLSFKMDDCTLEKLVVKPGKLTPSFNKSHLEYDVTVPSNVEKINIDPLTSDSGASYCIFVSRRSFVYIFNPSNPSW